MHDAEASSRRWSLCYLIKPKLKTINTMEITYRVPAEISAEEAAELYVEAGWMDQADAAAVEAMLRGTFAVSAAYCDGKLIGFMRALSDGVSDAYMLDLIVHAPERGKGVGRQILHNLADYLKGLGIDWTVCIGAPGTKQFYERTSASVMDDYTPYRF